MAEISEIPGTLDAVGAVGTDRQSIYVYEAPVRIWHWLNALTICLLAVTGYLIASPLPSMPGEASNWYTMGYIRFVHFASGQVLAWAFLYRVYWAFVGNEYARQLFALPIYNRIWRWGLFYELRWYLFLVRYPKKYIGHNPLANTAMFLFVIAMVLMMLTGFALYAEGEGRDSLWYTLFGWMFRIFPNSQDVHTVHHLGLWFIVTFVILHVYAALREDIVSRQSMLSAIVTGERTFRDSRPD
ncbi:Ni/Fe-hydrogenase, b-type cytochrome subunit [Bradyrhizobium sp. U531]|uniref:Ni/Fe-hydrogenase, b-type cytochrome subunit n=1 Tax=Bradyrhizobium sp. U531 TaxID=3053458 RepID=UPI003F437288